MITRARTILLLLAFIYLSSSIWKGSAIGLESIARSAGITSRDGCINDDCLQALLKSSVAAAAFCKDYLVRPNSDRPSRTQPQLLPEFAAPFAHSEARLSSACLCLPSALPTTPSATSPPACAGPSTWAGWSIMEYAFFFGDSYTTTGFNLTLTQPSTSNPLGNPAYPGYTASNGPNWVDYLTVQYNASRLLSYNLAYGGATVDSSLVAPYLPAVSSVSDQITTEFLPTYGARPPSAAPWTPATTLFAIFIGINDVGNSYSAGPERTAELNAKIFTVYADLVDKLFAGRAANFLFLNVPPVQRSPLTTAQGPASVALEQADIADFNARVLLLARHLKALRGSEVNVFFVDAYTVFSEVLDDPKVFSQTAGYRNMTAYCVAYENGTPTEDYLDPACGIPVNEYFWLNSLHPTYPMHDVLAMEVAATLQAGPNIC